MASHQSDSAVQRDAEKLILERISAHLGKDLATRTLLLDGGATVQVDGVDDAESVFVEVFARQGPLKGGQQKKVSQDALKLITLGRTRPRARLILAFTDDQAAAYATKGTWVSEALATWGVELLVVDIDLAVRAGIREAQVRQEIVNPGAPPPIH